MVKCKATAVHPPARPGMISDQIRGWQMPPNIAKIWPAAGLARKASIYGTGAYFFNGIVSQIWAFFGLKMPRKKALTPTLETIVIVNIWTWNDIWLDQFHFARKWRFLKQIWSVPWKHLETQMEKQRNTCAKSMSVRPSWNLQWTCRMGELLPWRFFNVRVMSWKFYMLACCCSTQLPLSRCPLPIFSVASVRNMFCFTATHPSKIPRTGWYWTKNPVVQSVLSMPSWIQKDFAAQKPLRAHLEMTEHTLETSWVTKLSSMRHNYFSSFSPEAARQAKFLPSSSSFSSSRWSHGSGSLSKILRAKTCSDLSSSRGNHQLNVLQRKLGSQKSLFLPS